MGRHLKPYPEYKDSGVPWLGEIPAHWSTIRTKYLLREMDDRTSTGTETLLSMRQIRGLVPHHEVSNKPANPFNLIGYKRTHPNDIVVNRMRASIGLIARTPEFGLVSPDYAVFRPTKDINTDYFTLLFKTPMMGAVFRIESKGLGTGTSGFLRLYSERFGAVSVPVPPRSEQDKILAFVQLQEVKIRRFIRNKRSLIKLLNEQKQVIINQAVTRGIDSAVSLKSCGISYLGDIPEHWDVRRLKTVSKILRGKFSHRPRNDPQMYDGQYPFIQTGDVARAAKYITTYKQTLNERGFAVSKQFPNGTLVMTIAANIGDVSILQFDACFPDSIVGFVPQNNIDLDFLYYALKSLKQELLKEAPVNTQGNLNVERVGVVSVPVMGFEEQKNIVIFIENEIQTATSAIARIQHEIELIQEYRTRLISDVVTGKIDVRDIEIPALPDEDIVEDLEDEELLEAAEAELEEGENADE